jgi:DnaJ-class molecular chaperone
MNREKAIKILNINETDNINYEFLKKQYRKQCLKTHPDKGGSKEDFVNNSDAYNFLLEEINNNSEQNYFGSDIIKLFTKIITTNRNKEEKDKIMKQLLEIVNNVSTKLVNNIDKDNIILLYELMQKYKHFINIDESIIIEVNKCIKKKLEEIEIIDLYPSLEDLFLDNLYVLNKEGQNLIIPLWHDELTYEINNKEYIVKINPELPDYCRIDNNNNIYFHYTLKINSELLNKNELEFDIWKRKYKVKVDTLKITKSQEIIFKNEGISIIDNKEIYKNDKKSNLIITLNLI